MKLSFFLLFLMISFALPGQTEPVQQPSEPVNPEPLQVEIGEYLSQKLKTIVQQQQELQMQLQEAILVIQQQAKVDSTYQFAGFLNENFTIGVFIPKKKEDE